MASGDVEYRRIGSVVGPDTQLDLGHQRGFQPIGRSSRARAPSQIGKRRLILLQPMHALREVAQRALGVPAANFARVSEPAAVVITRQ
jgi:hypothetical protein